MARHLFDVERNTREVAQIYGKLIAHVPARAMQSCPAH
jgi:hypothetical protein